MLQEVDMPQVRKYASRAEQQAAYRQRRVLAEQAALSQKSLPPLPAIPSMPGHTRWKAMLLLAQELLSGAASEMQDYHDNRSDEWQESSRGQEMLEKSDRLTEIVDNLQSLE